MCVCVCVAGFGGGGGGGVRGEQKGGNLNEKDITTNGSKCFIVKMYLFQETISTKSSSVKVYSFLEI